MKKLMMLAVAAVMAFAYGCETKDGLVNTSWSLVELNGVAVDRAALENEEAYTLNFEKDSTGVRVFGMGDCNRFFGTPKIDFKEGNVAFGNMGVTRMMCPNQKREDEYIKALSSATRFKMSKGSLVLMSGETLLATFTENKKK